MKIKLLTPWTPNICKGCGNYADSCDCGPGWGV